MMARKVLFAQVMLAIGYILGLFSLAWIYNWTKSFTKANPNTPRRPDYAVPRRPASSGRPEEGRSGS